MTIVLQTAIPWIVFTALCFWAIHRGREAKRIYLLTQEAKQKAARDSQATQSRQTELFPTQQGAIERAQEKALERARGLVGAGAR
jgi:hypothetical protein